MDDVLVKRILGIRTAAVDAIEPLRIRLVLREQQFGRRCARDRLDMQHEPSERLVLCYDGQIACSGQRRTR